MSDSPLIQEIVREDNTWQGEYGSPRLPRALTLNLMAFAHVRYFLRFSGKADMSNEPPASTFLEKVCQVEYLCTERGGVVWTRSGPWAARGARAARRPPATRCAEGVAAAWAGEGAQPPSIKQTLQSVRQHSR